MSNACKILVEDMDDGRILVAHVARIDGCQMDVNFFVERIDDRIVNGHVARIVYVSNACKHFVRINRS
jgi:hypothetical protein